MAIKTFKIGLSNTDKQNMAQSVYERLLALTFPEYDTSTEYSVGDFVVYNDQLYKCIGATTGAWDSSKWQLATLNDLVSDIEDAVQFVNDKANVDGNYPTMTVGVADQLSPYDEESGDDQDEPFSFQATGTGNGSQPDFSTGAIALMKEKRGNTVVVNQKAKPLTSGNWTALQANATYNNGVATLTATQQGGRLLRSIGLKVGHKFLACIQIKLTTATTEVKFSCDDVDAYTSATTSTQWLVVIQNGGSSSQTYLRVTDTRESNWDAIIISQPVLIDLTKWFNGNDNIPQDLLDHPENFFRYYQGSLAYNEGTLVNANGRYVKCIGRNQWDEEWELGSISSTTGQPSASSNSIRSKYFSPCIGGVDYHIYVGTGATSQIGDILFYDANQNFIERWGFFNRTFTFPQNAAFFKIALDGSYGTTYNHDITISLYYEGESGYDQYYPYEVLTNNDTGTEVLLAFDRKLPSGLIERNTKNIVDLSTLSWTLSQGADYWFFFTDVSSADASKNQSGSTKPNAISKKYDIVNQDVIGYDNNTITIRNQRIYCRTDSTSNEPSGELQYELAEPTTEQGTPYSENVVIDDFGSMDFSGTNGVPQGNLIFYPVDYKAFIDTLYDYTEGTPSNIALKSDLSSFLTMTDLSSNVETISGFTLTYLAKHCYKIGNMVFLTLLFKNEGTSSIAASTEIIALPSGTYNTTNGYVVNAIIRRSGSSIQSDASIYSYGSLLVNAEVQVNDVVSITVAYAVA